MTLNVNFCIYTQEINSGFNLPHERVETLANIALNMFMVSKKLNDCSSSELPLVTQKSNFRLWLIVVIRLN